MALRYFVVQSRAMFFVFFILRRNCKKKYRFKLTTLPHGVVVRMLRAARGVSACAAAMFWVRLGGHVLSVSDKQVSVLKKHAAPLMLHAADQNI